MASTAFADVLESVREAGTSRFSATNVADALGLQYQDLATLAGVHRNNLRTHPESPRLQAALRDLMRVLSAASAVLSSPASAPAAAFAGSPVPGEACKAPPCKKRGCGTPSASARASASGLSSAED